jgi:formate dehydrogenase iron-sulfur subunit
MTSYAILTDVTRCTGCEECVAACKSANGLPEQDLPWPWQDGPSTLSASRWTTVYRTREGRFVRDQCRHCHEPACVAACPVHALTISPEGAVVYDPDVCLGCRYCILACPVRITRFDYRSAAPRVQKCTLCHDRIANGQAQEPACTAACPHEATVFGTRDAMLAEARRRIQAAPQQYIDHIWGEHELGGTNVLVISDIPLDHYGWPAYMTAEPATQTAETVMQTVPWTFAGVSLGLGGLSWVINRRQKRAQERAGTSDPTVSDDDRATEAAPAGGADSESEETP